MFNLESEHVAKEMAVLDVIANDEGEIMMDLANVDVAMLFIMTVLYAKHPICVHGNNTQSK